MEFSSSLTLKMLGQPFLLEKRIALLYAIKEHGSISKAAKAVPMSYKSAWEAVDTMNNLAQEIIVQKETGGKNGGGSTITSYGVKLLETYNVLKEEHKRFLKRLAEVTDIQSGAFKTIDKLALQISARNQLQANVISIEKQKVNAKIQLKLKSGQTLIAVITNEAVENLHIQKEQNIIVIFKSSSVIFIDSIKEKQLENILEGIVEKIDTDQQNAKIVVNIGKEDKIVSVISIELFEKLGLCEGCSVHLSIKSNDILLGR